MPMNKDWFPGKREDQLTLAKIWVAAFQFAAPANGRTRAAEWLMPDNIPAELAALASDAEAALAEAKNEATRTPVATTRCKTTFDLLAKAMRDIKDRYLKKPPLADSDFVALGIPLKDTTRTPVQTPTGQAEADVNYPGVHLLMLRLRPVAGTLADAKADHGYRVYYGVLPPGGATVEQATGSKRYLMKQPASGEELPHSKFTRRQKELLDFPPEDSGKAAWFCIRYENSKGEAGPWGPMFSAVIP